MTETIWSCQVLNYKFLTFLILSDPHHNDGHTALFRSLKFGVDETEQFNHEFWNPDEIALQWECDSELWPDSRVAKAWRFDVEDLIIDDSRAVNWSFVLSNFQTGSTNLYKLGFLVKSRKLTSSRNKR